MSQLAPPPAPPIVAVGDDGRLKRVNFHLWQLIMTALTILITGWFCTFGAIPAILALMVAKHILVAILVMGLGVDSRDCVET
jgi:hypothetical protein